jgi:hypothetical protein
LDEWNEFLIKIIDFCYFSILLDFIDFRENDRFCQNPKNPEKHEKHGDGASDTDETRQNSYCLVPRHPPLGGIPRYAKMAYFGFFTIFRKN